MLINTRTALLFGSLLVALTGCPNNGGSNEPTVQVVVPAKSASVASGDQVTVMLNVKNAGETFYAAFDVVYDPLILQFINAGEGDFVGGNGGDETFFDAALVNGQPGRLSIGMTRVGSSGTVSGGGKLVSITFKAVGSGNSTIALSDPMGLRDDTDSEVEISSWDNGEITVE